MINILIDMTKEISSNLFVMLKTEKTHSSSVLPDPAGSLPGPAGSWAAGLGKRDRAEGGRDGEGGKAQAGRPEAQMDQEDGAAGRREKSSHSVYSQHVVGGALRR